MGEHQGRCAQLFLPELKEIFENLPNISEKKDRIQEIKIKHLVAIQVATITKMTIQQNIENRPMAPSTKAILLSLQAALEHKDFMIGELLDEIERLRLQQ